MVRARNSMNKLKYLMTCAYDVRETVCLASSPRSGSTWVKEMLVDAGNYDSTDEPLRLQGESGDKLKLAGFAPRTSLIDATAERKEAIYLVMENVLRGREGWLQMSPVFKRQLLIKFVRINRMLKESVERFSLNKSILLVRHPCAVVSSQLTMHGGNSIWSKVSNLADDVPSYLRDQISDFILDEPHKVLALNWAIDQKIPLFDSRPDRTLLVFYENLISNPHAEWERICKYLSIDTPNNLDKPSKTASGDLKNSNQNNKWKNKISAKVIDEILDICHRTGVDIYDDSELPLYDPWKKESLL
jgi:hypothetical protein